MRRLTVVKIQTKEILTTSRELPSETILSLEEGRRLTTLMLFPEGIQP
jgi:hypothetical protein